LAQPALSQIEGSSEFIQKTAWQHKFPDSQFKFALKIFFLFLLYGGLLLAYNKYK